MSLPAVFVSHGAPTAALEWGKYQQELRQFAQSIERPEAILSISAHWQHNAPLQLTASSNPATIHDFWGFPEELYRMKYDAPGSPELAVVIAQHLGRHGIQTQLNYDWGLDHGTWVPLSFMFPEADIPVLQLSIPIPRSPEEMFRIGQALQLFRDKGILIFGSGGVTHNLRLAMQNVAMGNRNLKPDQWAKDFDSWLAERLEQRDTDQILEIAEVNPLFRIAAPTTEHFDPIHLILGVTKANEGYRTIHESIEFGNLSLRSFSTEG